MGSVSRSSGCTACALDGTSLPASEQDRATANPPWFASSNSRGISGLGLILARLACNRRVRQPQPTRKDDEIGIAARLPAGADGVLPLTTSRPEPAGRPCPAELPWHEPHRGHECATRESNRRRLPCSPTHTRSPPSAQCLHRRRGKRRVGSRAARSRT